MRARVAGHKVAHRVRDELEERVGQPHRERRAERVAQPRGVLHRGRLVDAADAYDDRAPSQHELVDPRGLHPAQGGLRDRERAEHPQQVGGALDVARAALRGEALELGLHGGERVEVEQVAELGLTEQLGEQRGVEGERRGPALGERGVALVEVLRDVAEQQRARERRRRGRLHLDHADLARLHRAHQRDEPGHVVDVLEHLAHRLEHDGERAVLRRHRQQVRRTLALLPQRGALPGVAPGEQQRAGGRLAEARREQRGTTRLGRDERLHLVRVEQRRLEHAADDVVVLDVGQAQHDAVVGVHHLRVDAVPLAQPGADRERPGRVHLRAERRVQHHAPVAELVAQALDDEGAVVRHVPVVDSRWSSR